MLVGGGNWVSLTRPVGARREGPQRPVDTAVGVPMAAGVRYPFFGVLLSPMIASVALTSGRWPSSTRSGCAAIPSTARCRRQRNALMGRDVVQILIVSITLPRSAWMIPRVCVSSDGVMGTAASELSAVRCCLRNRSV